MVRSISTKKIKKTSYRDQNELKQIFFQIHLDFFFKKTTDCSLKMKIYGEFSAF